MKRQKITNKIPQTRASKCFDVGVWVILLFIFFCTAYPFYYVIIASFSNGYAFMSGTHYFLPAEPTLDNYRDLLSQNMWINAFKVSLFRTVVGTALTVMLTCLVSYALSRDELVFGKGYRFLVVFAMYVSGGLIPFYILPRFLGILNTLWVYVLPTMLDLFFVIVGISFFRSIPKSLIESARLDGASELKIFLRIVLPVSVPFVATLTLFSAVNQWNSWLDSTYYVNSESMRTVAYRMVSEINSSISQNIGTSAGGEISTTTTVMTTQATAMVVSMLPIMCVYPFLQKYFVQGIMLGAVKE